MQSFRLNMMKRGWFLGDFSPAVRRWKKGEAAVKTSLTGVSFRLHCNGDARYMLVVLDGSASVNGTVMQKGDIVIAEKNERLSVSVLQECKYLQLTYYEGESGQYASLDDFLNLYGGLFPRKNNPSHAIRFDDISVVVQGAVDGKITPLCLKSIRRFFPGSTIILSTWEGSDTAGLDYDLLVESRDPGCVDSGIVNEFDKNAHNNINRQLVSTQNGLKAVGTGYAMKLRSDMVLTTNDFLDLFDRFPLYTDELRIFKHKVIISDLFTKHDLVRYDSEGGWISFPIVFHVSDWFFFGLTEDLRAYFEDVPIMERDKMGSFTAYAHPERKEIYKCAWNMQFVPEQYLAIQALKKNGFDMKIRDWTDWNDELIRQSEDFIMNNFIILDFSHHGIMLPKYKNRILADGTSIETKGMYRYAVFEKLYNRRFLGQGSIEGLWDI